MAPGAHSELTVVAKVVLAGDEDLSNNETAPATVKVTYNNLPAVTDLAGEDTGNGIRLTWSEPDYHNFAPTVTEDFENLDSFATMNTGNTGGWTFVDLDKGAVGGFQGIEIPNVPIQSEASWFVMDQSNANFNQSFAGHSGTKSLAALFNYDGSQNDDWAISPELSGNAQTVSFYARAYSSQYPETIEVLYSTTDKDPANFVSAKVISGITTDADYNWTLYSVDLPAGAKYMAIRFISADTFMIMVDDVTYEPAGATADLELKGYNIYRNGVKINNALVTETNYDVEIKVDDAYYTVTAVYANGESRPSNEVSPYTGVENLLSGMSVKGMKGQIAISGADAPVAVIDMAGRVIYRGSNEVIPAPAGAYIVTVGKKTFKVLVK